MRRGAPLLILALVAGGCAGPRAVVADNGAAHDVACLAAAGELRASSNAAASKAAPVMFAYYLGRLEQKGLPDEEIQKRVDALTLEHATRPAAAELSLSCLNDVDTRLNVMQVMQKQNLEKLRAETRALGKK